MRLVAIGFLAALLGAGCALQAGDPGDDPTSPSTELRAAGTTPKVHGATVNPAASINPEPSPWAPTADIKIDDDSNGTNEPNGSNGQNPEPSPWAPQSSVTGGVGAPLGGAGRGTAGASGGSTPNRPGHAGAL
jgi:hypothetical protein